MSRTLVAAASAFVLSTSVAWAECSEDNWQDCAGKPWVDGDKMETPLGSVWWPNAQWGEGDEAGSTNWYTQPEVVLRALAEADQGKAYKLGHPYSADMPLFGARQFVLRLAAARNVDAMSKGECASMDDVNAALEKQGMTDFQFAEGDAILFRYGWESH